MTSKPLSRRDSSTPDVDYQSGPAFISPVRGKLGRNAQCLKPAMPRPADRRSPATGCSQCSPGTGAAPGSAGCAPPHPPGHRPRRAPAPRVSAGARSRRPCAGADKGSAEAPSGYGALRIKAISGSMSVCMSFMWLHPRSASALCAVTASMLLAHCQLLIPKSRGADITHQIDSYNTCICLRSASAGGRLSSTFRQSS